MKRKDVLFALLCILSLSMGCNKSVEVEEGNYMRLNDEADLEISAAQMIYYGTSEDGIIDLDILFYSNVSYAELDSIYGNAPLDKPYYILNFFVGTGDSTMIPNGTYPLLRNPVRYTGEIATAEFREIPIGGFGDIDPSESEYYKMITSGSLVVTSENGVYRVRFEGKTSTGVRIKMHYKGTIRYSSVHEVPVSVKALDE